MKCLRPGHVDATWLRPKPLLRLAAQLAGVAAIAFWAPLAQATTLPTCTQLGSNPATLTAAWLANDFEGSPQIISGTLSSAIIPSAPAQPANPPRLPTATPATPAYCQVSFTFSDGLSGPADGYDVGQTQMIEIQIVLPLSTADGGSGGVEGNWVGKLMVGASPGFSGSLGWAAYTEGRDLGDQTYAIRLGYIGSATDTGQHNPPFGVIQTGPLAHTLDLGTIADWAYRGTHYGKQWAVLLSQLYYGQSPVRTYYDGCSGGGNEGMGQLQNYGNEYDGFLIGAPAYFWQQFRQADSWPAIVFKKLVQQGGALPTPAQMAAVDAAAIAACDVEGYDTVKDGIISDPRACTFSATANICGAATAPAAPDCLTAAQAAAVDRIWDGPRNHYGLRIEYPFDRGIPFGTPGFGSVAISTQVTGSTSQVMQWDHKDLTFDGNNLFVDAQSLSLAGNPPNGITYEDEATLGANTVDDYSDNQNPVLDLAVGHGTKVIQLHGTADGAIRWRQDVDYYRQVGTWYGHGKLDFQALQSWYRFFMMPGVGHCTGALGGGVGPSAVDPFLALVNWVENGVAPDSILAQGGAGAPPTRTRPLCPFPETAIYNGTGSTDDASNFHCGGDLETRDVVCNDLLTVYKDENGNRLESKDVDAQAYHCRSQEGQNNQGHGKNPGNG